MILGFDVCVCVRMCMWIYTFVCVLGNQGHSRLGVSKDECGNKCPICVFKPQGAIWVSISYFA